MRGDCVDIPLVRGDSGGCFCIPLSEEVIVEIVLESLKCEVIVVGVGFVPYPSSVRLIFIWLSAHPSKCRGDLFYVLPLSVKVVFGERGVVYSLIVFA